MDPILTTTMKSVYIYHGSGFFSLCHFTGEYAVTALMDNNLRCGLCIVLNSTETCMHFRDISF